MVPVDRDQVREPTDAGDALALRARDFAGAGLVVFPVLAHLYSVALLLRLLRTGLPVSYKGRKAARDVWRLNLVIFAATVLCLGIIVAGRLVRD